MQTRNNFKLGSHGWIDYNRVARVTRMDLHIFGIWGIRKFREARTFYFIKFNRCVNSFQGDLVKRLYKVDA